MGEKITRENRKFKFETLQLHVGQEQSGSGNRCKSSSDLSDFFLCIPQLRSRSSTFRTGRCR